MTLLQKARELHIPFATRLCAALLISGLLTPSSALSYELLGADWTHQANPMGKDFVICASGAQDGAPAVLRQAAAKWNYSKFKFTFAGDRCLARGPNKRDGINYIDFGPLTNPSQAALIEWRNEPETKRMLECDIRFSSTRKWHVGSGAPDADENDLFSVALHEFGHCLGLDDTKVKGVVMTEQLDKGKMLRELGADDRGGRNALYGSP